MAYFHEIKIGTVFTSRTGTWKKVGEGTAQSVSTGIIIQFIQNSVVDVVA